MTLHVGTMGWSYDFWKGNFYPENLSSKEYLAYYASQFDTVEVDSTFYRIPRKQSVIDWKEQTPKGFLFSLKFPQVITHVKMLRDCQQEVAVFLERIELLEEKLGALLLQFPYTFGTGQLPLLRDFLRNLPKKHHYVVEVRKQKMVNDGFYNVLRDNSVALAWVDSPLMPQTSEITADFIYVRWEGDRRKVKGTLGRREADKTNSIKAWADKLRPFLDEQTEVFGYFSKYYSGHSPSDVRDFLENVRTGV
ncbi:DUF72 domain-containing protein [Candidatus Bathyarchaeota archaeon A05DMB-2]|jgi:uncharacterized protein YecE (DUF72 family)|nr:DUF72 domain-containing protein [Candidatus Bathyarchaeota archaeon A05DMB-2]